MTLHETYTLLLKRGMPECKWLNVTHYDHFEPGKGWIQDPILKYGSYNIDESDARDLITCAAVRWAVEMGMVVLDGKPEYVALAMRDAPFGKKTQMERSGMMLEAIIAATSHLDPH